MVLHQELPVPVRFLVGGLAGMSATSVLQPLDLLKTRMQMNGMNGAVREHSTTFRALVFIVRNEGVFAVYRGMSAALFRQATYTTTRLGVFTTLNQKYRSTDPSEIQFAKYFAFGVVAGACGAFVGTPADVALVRMTSDGRLPKGQQRGYRNVFNALYRIATEEGLLKLWRGCQPTVIRSVFMNSVQLSVYSQTKTFFLSTGYFCDDARLHVASSTVSGFLATLSSLPADIVKTRTQTANQRMRYVDTLRNIVRQEGARSLWKGFTPAYLRMGPHSILLFVFLEKYTQISVELLYGKSTEKIP